MANCNETKNRAIRRIESKLSHEAGQAIAEFVLVLFVLILVLFAILELGLLLNAKLVLASAAREIARICAVEGGYVGNAPKRVAILLESTQLGDIEVSITPRQAIYGTTIYVHLSYDYPVKSSVISAISRSKITLTAKAVTRSEFVPR